MVDLRQFFRADGYRLDFRRIAEVGIGTVFGALFTGIASVILGIADVPIALLSGFTNWLGRYIEIRFGQPESMLRGAFAGAGEFVQGTGFAGYFVALVIVLATFYVAAEVVSRVR